MSGLWRDHPATPRQQTLLKPARKRGAKPTQADVLISMLRDARSQNRALELPAIMQAGIAQHGARDYRRHQSTDSISAAALQVASN
jgi:hypothetical protein